MEENVRDNGDYLPYSQKTLIKVLERKDYLLGGFINPMLAFIISLLVVVGVFKNAIANHDSVITTIWLSILTICAIVTISHYENLQDSAFSRNQWTVYGGIIIGSGYLLGCLINTLLGSIGIDLTTWKF